MPSAFSIPKIYEQEIQAVVTAGYYSNKSEVVRDALRTFFDKNKRLRIAAAVELYQKKDVTLSKAAEIADLSFEEFKEVLLQRGIRVKTPKISKKELLSSIF